MKLLSSSIKKYKNKIRLSHTRRYVQFVAIVMMTYSCGDVGYRERIEKLIDAKRTEETRFAIILNPRTGCQGCFNFGYHLGQVFHKESIIITTEMIGHYYDSNNIVIVERDEVLQLVPEYSYSTIVSLDNSFEDIVIDLGRSRQISDTIDAAMRRPRKE